MSAFAWRNRNWRFQAAAAAFRLTLTACRLSTTVRVPAGSQVANQSWGLLQKSSPAGSAPPEWEEAPGHPLAVGGVIRVVSHEGTLLDPALAVQFEGEQAGW